MNFLHYFGFICEWNAAMTKTFSHSDVSEELRPVAGAPVIRQLSKQRGEDGRHKVLICEAEGSPKPSVSWSINGTSVCTLTLPQHLPLSYLDEILPLIIVAVSEGHIHQFIYKMHIHVFIGSARRFYFFMYAQLSESFSHSVWRSKIKTNIQADILASFRR